MLQCQGNHTRGLPRSLGLAGVAYSAVGAAARRWIAAAGLPSRRSQNLPHDIATEYCAILTGWRCMGEAGDFRRFHRSEVHQASTLSPGNGAFLLTASRQLSDMCCSMAADRQIVGDAVVPFGGAHLPPRDGERAARAAWACRSGEFSAGRARGVPRVGRRGSACIGARQSFRQFRRRRSHSVHQSPATHEHCSTVDRRPNSTPVLASRARGALRLDGWRPVEDHIARSGDAVEF